jgi:hypothetical protein
MKALSIKGSIVENSDSVYSIRKSNEGTTKSEREGGENTAIRRKSV